MKVFFDTLCKWHENVQMHNYIGFLVDNGVRISSIYNRVSNGENLADIIKTNIGITDINNIEELNYQDRYDFVKIRKVLLLFNVLTCDKYGQKFPFNLYRDNSYDVEHINSQTDNPIEKLRTPGNIIEEFGKVFHFNNLLFKFFLNNEKADAGDLIPLNIYCIIIAKPNRMIFNVNFIKYFLNENELLGGFGYNIIQAEGSINFIRNLQANQIGITQEEFNSLSSSIIFN